MKASVGLGRTRRDARRTFDGIPWREVLRHAMPAASCISGRPVHELECRLRLRLKIDLWRIKNPHLLEEGEAYVLLRDLTLITWPPCPDPALRAA